MACSHCMGPGPELGMGVGTMGYYISCRTVHTAPGPGMEPDPLSPIVPVPFPVPVAYPFPSSVNMPLERQLRLYLLTVMATVNK